MVSEADCFLKAWRYGSLFSGEPLEWFSVGFVIADDGEMVPVMC